MWILYGSYWTCIVGFNAMRNDSSIVNCDILNCIKDENIDIYNANWFYVTSTESYATIYTHNIAIIFYPL